MLLLFLAVIGGMAIFALVAFIWVSTADTRGERARLRRRRREWHDRHDGKV
ncbi:MAG: hypothetical protein AB7H79_04095 [Sphingomonas sp.]